MGQVFLGNFHHFLSKEDTTFHLYMRTDSKTGVYRGLLSILFLL